MKPRILIADDHTIVLEGIGRLLSNDYELVGTAADGQAVLRVAERARPDVVLLDIAMPLLNGIDACRQLVYKMPKTKVIFLTMHSDAEYVNEAFHAGGVAYLLKRSATAELTDAIKAVLRGGTYVTPLIDWKKPATQMDQLSRSRKISGLLTSRQREVLQLVTEGRTNKEIAALLFISEKTVDYHKASIKRELRLGSTAELTVFAVKHRIIGL